MADVREALRAFLAADATLAGLLTGGVFDADVLGADGALPSVVFDSAGRLKPCAVIRWRGAVPGSILEFTERSTCEIYFYTQYGYSTIWAAQRRCKTLINRKMPLSVNEFTGLNYFEWIDNFGEYSADEYQGAAADRSRYALHYSVTADKS